MTNTIRTKTYQFEDVTDAIKFCKIARLTVDESKTKIDRDEFVCGIVEVLIDGATQGDIDVLDAFRKNMQN